MKVKTIKSDDILASTRMDGSFHLSNAVLIEKTINKIGYQNLSFYTERIFTAGRNKRIYTKSDFGYPYLSNSDVILQYPFLNCNFNSKKYGYDKNALLHEGIIVTGRVGAIGQTAYITREFEEKMSMGSDNIIRIVSKDKNISGFLYAYMASKIGKTFLWKHATGGVQPYINEEMVGSIPIPFFPENKQLEIHNLIVESAELRVEANLHLNTAITLFESSIGTTAVTMSNQTDIVRFAKVKSFLSRFDGQYQIITKKLDEERTKDYPYIKIEYLAKKIFVGNRGKRNYVESGLPFLSSSDMMLFNPKRYAKQISTRTPNIDSLLVNRNDILISRSGTVGNVVLVGDDLNNCTVSEHALRLVIDENKIAPQYVFCFLKTKQGKTYMEASSFGSVIITLNEELIGNIEVPIINDIDKDAIVKLINDYQKKMDASTLKENQAIQLVENEIAQWQH